MRFNGSIQPMDYKNPTFRDFRFFFNKEVTLSGINSIRVEVMDPDERLNPGMPKIAYANYTSTDVDDRIVGSVFWAIEQDRFKGTTLVARVRLESGKNKKEE